MREVILGKILVSRLEASKGIQPEDYVIQLTLSFPLILSGHLCDDVKHYNPSMKQT